MTKPLKPGLYGTMPVHLPEKNGKGGLQHPPPLLLMPVLKLAIKAQYQSPTSLPTSQTEPVLVISLPIYIFIHVIV